MIESPDSALVADLRPSPNIEPRAKGKTPRILLLHYTGMASAEGAIRWLADPASKVSCHYVVDEGGRITQMVAEGRRAWHAGLAHWAGETDINSLSIGIEIQNPGHEAGYPPFPDAQISSVIALAHDICGRHPIPKARVLAHSDVAPQRKIDPGERFPWKRLAAAGVGHWVEPAPADERDAGIPPGAFSEAVLAVQEMLGRYGYGVPRSGALDVETEAVVRAFQRHFRRTRVDGRVDQSTITTLERLIAALPAV